MANLFTEEDLLKIINASKAENTQLDSSEIRYALYARKSAQGDEQQERSIDDQINDCMERVVVPDKLNLVKTVEEKFSAKQPETRKKFKTLIKDIEDGNRCQSKSTARHGVLWRLR